MKIRMDFVTNSSSASFIVATNLRERDMLGRIFNLDIPIGEKEDIKTWLRRDDNILDAHKMGSCVLKILDVIMPLKDTDGDYIEMVWLDDGTGNVRYKHIFVYKVYQCEEGWSELFQLLRKFEHDPEIFVKHCYWG